MSVTSNPQDPTTSAVPIRLAQVNLLLENDYLPFEAGYALTEDNMLHIAASTYMHNVSPALIDWWFGFLQTTEHYKLWHPRDHVFLEWEGPRENNSEYVGGHAFIHEYVGGELAKLKVSFKSPGDYFGANWKKDFEKYGYGTAVCARVGNWEPETGKVTYIGHIVHLIKQEPHGCRMRSRFWLGDVEGLPKAMGDKVPAFMTAGLLKHATEEMAILATQLVELHQKYGPKAA